jgi:hypothetical protein
MKLTLFLNHRCNLRCTYCYTGENDTLHWVVEEPAYQAWQAARRRLGVGLNSLLTAAWFEANRRWHRAMGLEVGRTRGLLATELRPRDRPFPSFANHLASFLVEVPLDRVSDAQAMARLIHQQVQDQRARHAPEKRFLAQAQVVGWMTLEQIHRVVYEERHPVINLDFSNLIPLEIPPLGGEGWAVDELLITTPASPRIGVVLTAIRYRGRVVFNLNYKSSVVERAQATELLGHLQAALADWSQFGG